MKKSVFIIVIGIILILISSVIAPPQPPKCNTNSCGQCGTDDTLTVMELATCREYADKIKTECIPTIGKSGNYDGGCKACNTYNFGGIKLCCPDKGYACEGSPSSRCSNLNVIDCTKPKKLLPPCNNICCRVPGMCMAINAYGIFDVIELLFNKNGKVVINYEDLVKGEEEIWKDGFDAGIYACDFSDVLNSIVFEDSSGSIENPQETIENIISTMELNPDLSSNFPTEVPLDNHYINTFANMRNPTIWDWFRNLFS